MSSRTPGGTHTPVEYHCTMVSWTRWIQSITSHLISVSLILILSSPLCLGLLNSLFPINFPTKILHAFIIFPHECYMTCLTHLPWFYHNIPRRVQVMKILIMQLSPATHHSLCLRSKYSLQPPSTYVLPSILENTFDIHAKQHSKL
jgi:hypothetical protein